LSKSEVQTVDPLFSRKKRLLQLPFRTHTKVKNNFKKSDGDMTPLKARQKKN
jgi:hypothetical protein